MTQPMTDPVVFITYPYDEPDEAPAIDVSPSLTQARRWLRPDRSGYIYRYERQPDGSYGNESFVEYFEP